MLENIIEDTFQKIFSLYFKLVHEKYKFKIIL